MKEGEKIENRTDAQEKADKLFFVADNIKELYENPDIVSKDLLTDLILILGELQDEPTVFFTLSKELKQLSIEIENGRTDYYGEVQAAMLELILILFRYINKR